MRSTHCAMAACADFVRSGGKLRRLAFTDERRQRLDPVATVYSNYVVELDVAGQVSVQRERATEVFVLRDGVWTNPAWHLDSGQ